MNLFYEYNFKILQLQRMNISKQKIIFLGPSLEKGRMYNKLHNWSSNDSPYIDTYSTKIIQYEQKTYELGMWGTLENEKYYPIIFSKMRTVDGYIFIYDVGDPYGMKELNQLPIFMQNLKENRDLWKTKLLVGVQTKSQRKISYEEGQNAARKYDMMFKQISWEQSERSVLDLLGRFAKEIQQRKWIDKVKSQQKWLNEKIKLDRKDYVAQIKRLNDQLVAINEKGRIKRATNIELAEQNCRLEQKNRQLLKRIAQITNIEKQTAQKLANIESIYQKAIEPINSKHLSQVFEIIQLYEKDTLKIREAHEKTQRHHETDLKALQVRCMVLERICEECEGVTISNLAQKISFISEEYSKYKDEYYLEHRMSIGEDEPPRLSSLSEILQGLNISQIFEQ